MYRIPGHLPPRLAICYYGHDWLSASLPGDHYGDLERTVVETAERGFNTIRAEMGLNWMFDLDGRRRGAVAFTDWIPGASENLHCMDGRGGACYDVFERVLRLFELAQQHDLYVIATSWEYAESTPWLADDDLRDQVFSVPVERRLLHLAHQIDHLIRALEDRGLERRLAFVEVHNEIIHRNFPLGEENRRAATDAIAYLRERHPNLLITVDYARLVPEMLPDNAQVLDHHVYVQGLTQAVWEQAGIAGWGGQPPDLAGNRFLREILKPDPMPWEEFLRRAARVRHHSLFGEGCAMMWFYDNVDVNKYDFWCLRHFGEYAESMRYQLQERFREAGEVARRVGLPAVVDEGYVLYPPRKSQFVDTAAGRWIAQTAVEAALANDHWGVLPDGYFRPNTINWNDQRQVAFIRDLNRTIRDTCTA
ncbi:MAG: hypothetical protein ACYC5M_16505 [Anaerolineae bacterium]